MDNKSDVFSTASAEERGTVAVKTRPMLGEIREGILNKDLTLQQRLTLVSPITVLEDVYDEFREIKSQASLPHKDVIVGLVTKWVWSLLFSEYMTGNNFNDGGSFVSYFVDCVMLESLGRLHYHREKDLREFLNDPQIACLRGLLDRVCRKS